MPGYILLESNQDEIPSKYLCSYCGCLLRDPVQTACGHCYCRSCLDNYLLKWVISLKKNLLHNINCSYWKLLINISARESMNHWPTCTLINMHHAYMYMNITWYCMQRCQPPKFKMWKIFWGLELLLCQLLKCSHLFELVSEYISYITVVCCLLLTIL